MTGRGERLTLRALNRALLARQGLLERLDLPLVDAVEAVGALQAQHWPALPVALWSRVRSFASDDLYSALARSELVTGTLLRATLHLVSAREHPAYAAVIAAAGIDDWRRTEAAPRPEVEQLRAQLRGRAQDAALTTEQLAAAIEEWLAAHPAAIDAAELEHQRKYGWRAFARWSGFVRAPADGRWGPKAPAALRAAPGAPAGDTPLEVVVRRHLRAFGPAAADDVACWIGIATLPVRDALQRLEPELALFEDDDGRRLYDLEDAPCPDPQTPAPPRFLAAFDSVLLAYATKRRQRILADAHRDAVYERANLRIRPTFLIDGFVGGTWSSEVRRREATLTMRPFDKRLPRPARTALVEEGERLVRAVHPMATAHAVVLDS